MNPGANRGNCICLRHAGAKVGSAPSRGAPIRHGASGVPKRLAVARRFADWSGATVLDLGCGNGAYAVSIAEDASRVVGLDIELIHLADCPSLEKLHPVLGAAEQLPFADATFDLVFCIETLEHVFDERATLDEIHRVLRLMGRLIVSVPNKWFIFDTHGLRHLPGSNRYPFASWLPSCLHSRIARARIYTAAGLRRTLQRSGFAVTGMDAVMPPLDKLRPTRLRAIAQRVVAVLQRSPARLFGVSLVAVARKDAPTSTTAYSQRRH